MTSSESLVGSIAANGDAPTPGGDVDQTADEQYFGHEHVTVIEPIKGWRSLDLKELWAYRELFWVLTMRDIKVRYKQTVLGAGWAIIQPVMTMVVFSIIFGGFAKMPSDGFPYPDLRLCGSVALDLLCQCRLTRSGELRWSARPISSARSTSRASSFPLSSVGSGHRRLRHLRAVMLLALMLYFGVAWITEPVSRSAAARWCHLHGAGGGHASLGAECGLPRLPLCHTLPDSVVDVRDAGHLSGELGAGRVALASLPQPDGRHHRRLPLRLSGQAVRSVGGSPFRCCVAVVLFLVGVALLRKGRAPLRRHHLMDCFARNYS